MKSARIKLTTMKGVTFMNFKRKTGRFLAMLLAAVMMVTSVPMDAWAAEVQTVEATESAEEINITSEEPAEEPASEEKEEPAVSEEAPVESTAASEPAEEPSESVPVSEEAQTQEASVEEAAEEETTEEEAEVETEVVEEVEVIGETYAAVDDLSSEGTGTSTDPYRIEIENGSANLATIKDAIAAKRGDGTSTKAGYYYSVAGQNSWSSMIKIPDDPAAWDDSIVYELGTGIKIGTIERITAKDWYFSTRTYYNITLDIVNMPMADDAAQGSVTFGNKTYTENETVKVYRAQGARAFSVADVEGYNVKVTYDGTELTDIPETITPDKSATIKVEYIEQATEATVKMSVEGNGTVTVAGTVVADKGSTTVDSRENVVIVATPADGQYVDAITVNGEPVSESNISFANTVGTYELAAEAEKTYEIEVIFAERTVPVKAEIDSIGFNPKATVNEAYVNSIETAIFNAIIDPESGITQDDVTIKLYIGAFNSYSGLHDGVLYSIFNMGFGTAIKNDGASADQETIEIVLNKTDRYPEVSLDGIKLSLYDDRADAGLTDGYLNGKEYTNVKELEDYVKEQVSSDTEINPNRLDVTIALTEGELPTECNTSKTVKYLVTFAGDVVYRQDTCVVTIDVTLKASQCTVAADASVYEHGSIKVNNSAVAADNTATVDGLAETTVTVTPASDTAYAVKSITVKAGEETVATSAISYSDKAAAVTFTTEGENGAVAYTVFAEYEEAYLNGKTNASIEYCYDQQKVTASGLQKMVFDAVYEDSNPGFGYNSGNLTVEYSYVGLGSLKLWAKVGESPAIQIGSVTHKFGEDGTETIRLTYKDEKYGKLTFETELTVIDACYNNTVEINNGTDAPEGSKVDISTSEATEEKNGKYKENTEYTVTVVPGNSLLEEYPTEASYVKAINVTDKNGNAVETSALEFKEAGTIFGIVYEEPAAYITFKTGSNEAYKINAEYGTSKLEVTVDELTLDMYQGADGIYSAQIPTAEDIYKAVITGADPAEWANYDASKVKVEYTELAVTAALEDLVYKSLDSLSEVKDGTTVRVRIVYDAGSLQYHKVAAYKDITLKDPRTATVISATEPEEAVEFISDADLADKLKAAMELKVLADDTVVADAQIDVIVDKAYEEDGQYYVDVTASYAGSENYKPCTASYEKIPVKDIPGEATVNVVSEHGSVTVEGKNEFPLTVRGESTYEIKAVPETEWVVESIEITADDDTEETLKVEFKEKTATAKFTPAELKSYTVTVNYAENKFTLKDELAYAYKTGLEEPFAADIFMSVVEVPEYSEDADLKVTYLAREAGTYTIEIPKIEIAGITVWAGGPYDIELEELWLEVDADIEEVDLEALPGQIVSGEISLTELAKLPIGAHEFGENGDGSVEKIKISYDDGQYSVKDVELEITIEDSRIPTEIAASNAEVTYGYTEAELLAAVNASVMADGTAVSGDVKFAKEVTGKDASETPYEVELVFAGNEDYQPSKTTVEVTVKKATCTLSFESQTIRFGTPYTFALTKNPEEVKTINFMLGLDVSEGANGYAQIVLPGKLGEYFSGEMKLSELTGALEGLAGLDSSLLEGLGFDASTITALNKVLGSAAEELGMPDIRVKVNGDIYPENIGVYLAGAVTADSNFETEVTAGYLVITPNGQKADLDWIYDDENGFITRSFMNSGACDLGAEVTNVYEGTIEAAQEKVTYLYLGLDADFEEAVNAEGNVVLKRTKDANDVADVGAYVQIAYIEDFGNEMYYAEPLVRTFAIVPEVTKVVFVDETGAENADRTFSYDGTAHAMTAVVYDINGNKLDDAQQALINYRYLGYDANDVNIYDSEKAPVNAGAYTVIATYVNKEDLRMGAAVGAMVIKPSEEPVTITVDSMAMTYGEDYDSAKQIHVSPADCKTVHIMTGLSDDGTLEAFSLEGVTYVLSIDFPERIDTALEKLLAKAENSALSAEFVNWLKNAYSNGVTIDEFKANADSLKKAMETLGYSEEIITTVLGVLDKLSAYPGTAKIAFADLDGSIISTGAYLVGAVTCDPNYQMAAGFGILVVAPNYELAELTFNQDFDNELNYVTIGTGFDFGVTGTVKTAFDGSEGTKLSDEYIKQIFLSVDAEGNFSMTETAPEALGLYTQIAYGAEYENHTIYAAAPIVRTFTIIKKLTDVSFEGEKEVIYDGQQHGLSVVSESVNAADIEIHYYGIENGIEFYNSTEAPVNAGVYVVTALYKGDDTQSVAAAIDKLEIKRRSLAVTIDKIEKLLGDEDPEFTYSAENLVAGDTLKLTLEREAGEDLGEYKIYCTSDANADNLNYDMTVEDGSLTIKSREITVSMNDLSKIYGDEDPELTYEITGDELLGEDAIEVVNIAREEGEDVGEYAITAEAVYDEERYDVTVLPGVFTIEPKTITEDMFEIVDPVYTGKEALPEIITDLERDKDFTVTCTDINAGEATLTLTGIGNYTGIITIKFNIKAQELSEIKELFALDAVVWAFTGKEIKPEVLTTSGLPAETYTVSYEDNLNPGTGKIIITGDELNCTGSIELEFVITVVELDTEWGLFGNDLPPVSIEAMSATVVEDQVYTGKSIKPAIEVYHGTVKLTKGKDYTVTYKYNKNVFVYDGQDAKVLKKSPQIIIKGKGNYKGTQTVHFNILPKDINELKDTINLTDSYVYNKGKNISVKFSMKNNRSTLKNKKNYTYALYKVEENGKRTPVTNIGKAVGEYEMDVTGIGNFTGQFTLGKIYVVDPKTTEYKAVSKLKVTAKTITYGERPRITVKDGKTTLIEGIDYAVDVSYENAGKVTAVIIGLGEAGQGTYKYEGTKKVTFRVKGISISKAVVAGIENQKYTGSEWTLDLSKVTLTVKDKVLNPETDYTVSYKKNINKGTATVTFKGIGNYEGTRTKTFKIGAYSIANADVTCVVAETAAFNKNGAKAAVELTYNGMTLVEKKDYTVSYKNNKKLGTAAMTIKGKGNYTGTIQKTYAVVEQDINDLALVLANVTYSKKKGNYKSVPTLYDLSGKTLSRGKDYTVKYYDAAGNELASKAVLNAGDKVIVKMTAVAGKGYVGEITKELDILTSKLSGSKVKTYSQYYTGRAVTLSAENIVITKKDKKTKVTETLVLGQDFEILDRTYKNNVKKGTANVRIRGINNYSGVATVKFKIVARPTWLTIFDKRQANTYVITEIVEETAEN